MNRLIVWGRALCLRGIRSESGGSWVSVSRRQGYIDLDTHGLPRPLSATEARHLAWVLTTHADVLEPPAPSVEAA